MRNMLVAALFISTVVFAEASEYGCKVLLCLSNPVSNGGPKGVAECVQPINQLYRDLRKGRAFPRCDLSDGNDGSNYARIVFDPYDPCPPSLQAAKTGSYVVQGKLMERSENPHRGTLRYKVQGSPQLSEPSRREDEIQGSRACVGNPVGLYHVEIFDERLSVVVFDQVLWQPAKNPQAIDVFINGALLQRVRW